MKKKQKKQNRKDNTISSNKNKYIPKADVEMLREEQYEKKMFGE